MSGVALAAWLALAPVALEVTGDATCPAPADVARRLDGLAPATKETPAGGATAARVIVTHDGPALRLVLLGPNSNELATRELRAEGTCEDLAAAAAVVVAAWQADLNPDLTPAVALPARPAPATAAPQTLDEIAAPATPSAPPWYELGLGFVASDAAGDLAPGAMLRGGLGRDALGLVAALIDTTSRSAAVGALADAASWTRVTLAVGPAWAPHRGSLRGDVHVQGLVGFLHVRGQGLMDVQSDTTAQLGAAAGGRLELVTGTSALWLGFDALGWPGAQRLIISGNPSEGRLPRLELLASLGLSFGRFP